MKRCLPLFTILCLAGTLIAQPPNDDCSTATVIGPSNLDDGTMTGNCAPLTNQSYIDATPWEVSPGLFFTGSCWGGAVDSVVFYSFVAQGVSGSVEVTNGPATAHVSVLDFNVTCDGTDFTEVGCAVGAQIVYDNQLIIGTTYYIVVGFENSVEGTFDICVFNPVPAVSDNCVNAIDLPELDGDGVACNNNLNNYYPSSETIVPSCFPAGEFQSVWYSFVAQGVSIAELYVSGSSDNAHLAIWDFSGTTDCNLSAGVLLVCETDVTSTNAIVLDNDLTIGNTYYIEVVFENNATGDFNICIDNPVPAFNDDCNNSEEYPSNMLDDSTTCHTVVGGNDLNNDWPSTDIGTTYGCWNTGETYNVWFWFTAQGPDLDVTVDALSFSQAEQIAVIEFTGSACDPLNWVILQCANGDEIDINNNLEIGHTYYVTVGFENNGVGDYCINIFNPEPPENDTACAAIQIDLNGTSVVCANPQPTTIYANPEFDPNSFPNGCQTIVDNTVWYTMQMSDPNNVGFSIDVQPTGLTGDVSVVLFEEPDCDVPGTFSIAFYYCGPAPADPLEWGPINDNSVYYLMIGSAEGGQGDFNLCVSEIPPCFTNNFCLDPNGISSAFDLGTPDTQDLGDCTGGGGPAFVCADGCNQFADPEPGLTGCLGNTDPAVWYTFQTDGNANILNMTVTSDDFDAPSVQLFFVNDIGDPCGSLVNIGLTENLFSCMVGSNGQVVANGTAVSASSIYYIVVGGVNTLGGNFEICISALEATAPCVTDAEVVVEARSFGGPLTGPFFPGEVLDICMNVNVFLVSTGDQNCQWMQGLVPVFGNGWDPGSFDAENQPIGATMNGNSFPAPNVENGGQWDWWTNIMYHHEHCYYNVEDFDGNGTVDMCNGLYDIDCTGPGLAGGCCGPCWSSTGPDDPGVGSPLPPGWFTSGVDGTCPGLVGWPAVDWGDGNTCNGPTGPWEFCFEMTILPYPDCEETELSLGFVTFADGETGSWFGNASVCGEDEPVFQVLPNCCTDLTFLDDIHDPFCSGGVFTWLLDHPNATFWEWTVEASSSIIGESGGNGPPGTVVVDNLSNSGTDVETVIYHFLGFDGGECPSVIWDVSVDVYPPILVTMDPFTVCGTPTDPYIIVPTVEGGDPSTYSYLWQDGSTNPTFAVTMPVQGQQYILTVTDAIGCSGSASVVLDVYTTFPVDIIAPITEQCLVDGTIALSADASGGTGTFTFNWTGPSGQMFSGPDVDADESGEWLVVAEDSDGCEGRDSVTLNFHESPDVAVFPENVAVCPDNPIGEQIQALVTGGESPYLFEWDTPGGIVTTSFILVDEAGDYGITVTDNNGCTSELQFEVFEQESPEPELAQPEPFCPDDLDLGYIIEVTPDPSYVYYTWSNGGPQGPDENAITVTDPGFHQVTVTNEFGCKGVANVFIDEHLPPLYDAPDTIPFCAGNFIIVDATEWWVSDEPFDPIYEWDGQGVGGNDPEQFIFNEGLYFLTVTDDNGCTAMTEFYAVPQDFIDIDIIGDSVICNGVPALIMASPDFESYEWSTSEETQSILATVGDQYYYVTVSDGDGCFGVDSVYVPASAPAPGIQGESVCEGDAATLDVGIWNGILWSTGHTTSTITTDTAGTFFVTVTDQLGCTNTASYTVTIALKPTPDIQGVTSFCQGSSTTLNAGGVFSSYMWSTNETTPEITVNTSATVWVMVTNAAGCEAYDTVSVTATPLPVTTITGDSSICNNVAVQLNAGPGFASYTWTGGGTGQTLDANTPGTYFVTVTDAQGCTDVDQIVVIATAPTPVINGINAVCEGNSELLSATPGFVSYSWTGGGTNQTLSVNATGIYIVTVTDQYGCQGTAAHAFTVHPNPVPTINGSSTFCPGSDTELDAGAGYDFYQWSGGGGNGQLNTVNTSGVVSVTVTDGNGCTGVTSVFVQESNELTLNPQDKIICEGDAAILSVGTFDTYQWSTTETTPTISVTMPGTYGVTVTDGGCSGTANIVVTVNQMPFANVASVTDACNDAANGSTINFAALITGGDTGGTWSDIDNSGASGNFPVLNFDGVPYGVYTFEYTTNSAVAPCSDVSYLVEVSIGTSPELLAAPDLCNDGDQLNLSSLIVPGSPGGGAWTIVGAPPGGNPATIIGTTFNASNADPGTYTIQYQISGIPGNCPDSDTQTITVSPEPNAGFTASAAQICVGEDSVVILSQLLSGADGGGMWIETSSTPSSGNAFNSGTGTFRTTSQNPGMYTFEYVLNGADPCPDASTTVEVMIENVPQADAGIDGTLTCDITSVVLGGGGSSTGPEFDYIWTTTDGIIVNPSVLNTTVTNSGTYTLTVINSLTGCESSDVVVVDLVGDIPTDLNLVVYSPECKGDPPGSAQVMSVVGGTPPYSYSLNGAPVTSTPNWNNLTAGDYTLLVTDDLGCKYETQFSIGTANDLAGELTGEILIESGDDAVLSYLLTAGVTDSTVWYIDGTPVCINCDTLVFTPIGQTQVQLTIYDPRDCEITLFTTILVHVTRNVYVPNVFSPNGDAINDFFTLFASNTVVTSIEYLQIFTRWGDKVFEAKDILPAVEALGWDGTFGGFGGEPLMPGVYVFHAKVHYADDVEEIFKGDITLVR
ncbi:MAG TPA: gliding motility-associated C-terminal domain-containing protein [Saprospiraceae bacterium]|nr:gliding motility-associated C-terminal domain-containing protein [Saprospiraceae bacterium]